jgi:hypothetical protein
LPEIDPATLDAARKIIEQHERTKKVDVLKTQNEQLEQALEMALTRTQGDVELAADLFERWCESDSQMRDGLLRPLIREAIERRLAAIPRTEPKLV